MKRKKVMAITAMVFTCATIASCGKTTETVNAEPVVQATEQIVLETEEIVQEATEKMEEENLQPQIIDGVEVYPDYPETYIKFTPLDPPKEMYCIDMCTQYLNPNMQKGELVSYATLSMPGDKLTFNATCEVEGKQYYRFTQDNTNLSLIVPADCWSETPPTEDTNTDTSYTYIDDNGNEYNPYTETPEEAAARHGVPWIGEGDPTVWDTIDPEIIEQMGRLQYE